MRIADTCTSKLCSSISVTSLITKTYKGNPSNKFLSLHCGELLLVNTMALCSCTAILIFMIFIGMEPTAAYEVRIIIYSSTSIQMVIVVRHM